MGKEYSLAVGRNKIRELKKNKGGVISHRVSKRWEGFVRKNHKKVRFFDTVFHDECVCVVVNIEKVRQLGELTIKMKVTL